MDNLPAVLSRIRPRIFTIRKRRVMLDTQLAELYGVKPIRLREQVRRNAERFPEDFMFQLTAEEAEVLVPQNPIPSRRSLGGHLPFFFTQEGIAMLPSVLRSPRHDGDIARLFEALRDLMDPTERPRRKIGFLTD